MIIARRRKRFVEHLNSFKETKSETNINNDDNEQTRHPLHTIIMSLCVCLCLSILPCIVVLCMSIRCSQRKEIDLLVHWNCHLNVVIKRNERAKEKQEKEKRRETILCRGRLPRHRTIEMDLKNVSFFSF